MVDHSAALLEQNTMLGALLAGADWSAPVPTCPGWTLLQLLRHVGRGDRWAAQIVNDRATTELDPRLVREGRPPDDPAGALAWLAESAQVIIEAVSAVGPGTPVATFLGPRPACWWTRRRLHEATVHRFDAANALGTDYELSSDVAVDGLEEWLDRIAEQSSTALWPGQTLTLRASDAASDRGEAWVIRGIGGGISWHREAPVLGTVLTGSATGLFLAMVRRLSADRAGVTVTGDQALWRRWLELTPL